MINLKEQYGKRYKVARCEPGEVWCYEIKGKYGYIRPFGTDLELYISRRMIEGRIERESPAFKPKNHYDDATAFVFANDPGLVASACKWIKAKNRRHLSPEARQKAIASLTRMRSLRNKPAQASVLRA